MLLQRVVELITPTSCLNCGSDGAVLCVVCLPNMATASAGTCVRCNRLSSASQTCKTCRNHLAVTGVSVASYYDKAVKELILQLKFQRNRAASRAAAELIFHRLSESKMTFDLVTSVPISPARYRERGYNQSELIAKAVSRRLKLPYSDLLGRRNGEHQIGKDRRTRLEQVKDVFYVQKAPPLGSRVLIIDDVVTTGATLDACARQLKLSGAKTIWGAVVAKH